MTNVSERLTEQYDLAEFDSARVSAQADAQGVLSAFSLARELLRERAARA